MERLCLASLVIVSVVFFVEATAPDCPHGVGEPCGGLIGKLCCSGLVCKLKGNFPDAGGRCVPNRIGNVGDCCGGHSGIYCRRGLFCKFGFLSGANGRCVPGNSNRDCQPDGDFGEYCNFFTNHHCKRCYECYPTGEMVDDGGICLPKNCGGRVPAQCGEQCGTIVGITCKPPLICVLDDPEVSDSAGMCLPKKKDNCEVIPRLIGCFCGGIAGFPCADGLECKLDGSYPDAGGKCIRKDEGAGPGECCGGKNGRSCRHGLVCKLQGNYPGAGGKCCGCDKSKGEIYSDCGSACIKTCQNYKENIFCIQACVKGCFCPHNKVRLVKDGPCVNIEDCPRTDCTKGCDKSKGEVYSECGSTCNRTCENYKYIRCSDHCEAGCYCKSGEVRNWKGECVDPKDCEKTVKPGELGGSCAGKDEIKCNAGLMCKKDGEYPDACGTCVEDNRCDKRKGEVWLDCGSACPLTCENYKDKNHVCTLQCVIGCGCPYGTVRRWDRRCVKPEDCSKRVVYKSEE